jgi:hypothetical protein
MPLSRITSNAFSSTANTTVDNGTFHIDPVNNRVGIGTKNPLSPYTLDVRGGMRLGDGTSVEQDIEFYGNEGSIWQVGTNNSGPSASNWFYVYKSGIAYPLAIDSNGRVTMPRQPRYHYTGGTTVGAVETVIIPTNAVIASSDYSTSTGRFTAPIGGTYQFGVWGLLYPADATDTWTAQFTRNGSTIGQAVQGGGNSTSHAAYHASIIAVLSAGDWVDFRLNTGNNGVNAYGSQWNQYGYLLG